MIIGQKVSVNNIFAVLHIPSKSVLSILVKKTVNLEWLQKNQDIVFSIMVFRMVVGKRVCAMDGS